MAEKLVTMAAATILASGIATRYDEGLMDVVVAKRILFGQIPENQPAHKGYVALLDCEHLGRLVWLERRTPQRYGEIVKIDGPYLVADCTATRDRDRLKRLGWAVDLSWEVAQEWGVIDDVGRGFMVWDADPRFFWDEYYMGSEPGMVAWR